MIWINLSLLLIFMALSAVLGIIYYAPGLLPLSLLDPVKLLVHGTRQSQDITFVVFYVLIALCLLLFVLLVTTKQRGLKRRRKKLIKMFDEYGAKYAAEDKEINF